MRSTLSTLDPEAVLLMKSLINSALPDPSSVNLREVLEGVKRFETGRPQKVFAGLGESCPGYSLYESSLIKKR